MLLMFRRMILIILFVGVAVVMVNIGLTVQAQSNNWSLEGRFVNYTSLSSPPKPDLSPQSIIFGANTGITMGAFGADFVGEPKNPLMLIVEIKNSTNSAQTLILPFPSDVIIHAGSFSESAVAFYSWWGRRGWVIGGSGKVYTNVEQGDAAEFVYLIPRINGQITVEFGDVGSFKINAADWLLKGRPVYCDSVCDLTKSYKLLVASVSVTVTAVTDAKLTNIACSDLEKELGRSSTALFIWIQNLAETSESFVIPFPSDVVISDGNTSRNALALYWPIVPMGWATGGSGIMKMEIKPDAAVELLYLVPKLSGEDIVTFGDIGSFTVEQFSAVNASKCKASVTWGQFKGR